MSDDRYPVAADAEFLAALHNKLAKENGWATPQLFKAVQFAWGVLLREYASRQDLLVGKSTNQGVHFVLSVSLSIRPINFVMTSLYHIWSVRSPGENT